MHKAICHWNKARILYWIVENSEPVNTSSLWPFLRRFLKSGVTPRAHNFHVSNLGTFGGQNADQSFPREPHLLLRLLGYDHCLSLLYLRPVSKDQCPLILTVFLQFLHTKYKEPFGVVFTPDWASSDRLLIHTSSFDLFSNWSDLNLLGNYPKFDITDWIKS